ncbi:NAD(P)-dependent oxidoreductase [Actinomadura sp. HBU206391]|uniref:NAD(P)-dependent oxidoreductase n=1 Tax=Actinomadura sp. HBU206391 TaxID=2731692 RepID=UPI0016508D19|nr:NAD(P)-binding domain-containing protein [Actinomadura sp. HBU206391]MBC6459045.1 NAD(P)-dependent oxidoreductase [Actinomadura sp. HBU206391]
MSTHTGGDRAPVTVIGLGAMGSAMAETFLRAGHPTTVWNRTASRADPLVAQGAALAASPADALAASDLAVVSQVDYEAMYDSLGPAEGALKGRVLVNLSSGTPQELRRASAWAAGHGAELLPGGIMVPPPGIGRPGAYVFYSGSEAALDRHRRTLAALGTPTYVGADAGLAMLYYQAMLYVFWSGLSSYFHAAALVGTAGVPAKELLPFVSGMFADLSSDGPMGFLRQLTGEIDAGAYPGEFNNLRMQAVGMDHIVHASRDAGLDTGVPEALKELFERAVERGHGSEGLTSVIEVIKEPKR